MELAELLCQKLRPVVPSERLFFRENSNTNSNINMNHQPAIHFHFIITNLISSNKTTETGWVHF